jgi:choline dehydrogenase-like flavoprotein
MIRDLDTQEDAELSGYDLCIVGSGPAGTTLANELAGSGLRVCVLESGLARTTPRGDALRAVRSEGIRIKEYSRERVLGGASTTWAGLSSPLDPIDFEPRAYLGLSGWPIPRDEMLDYYARAAERYRFPALAMFEAEGFGALRRKGDLQPSWSVLDEKIFLAASEPQDFGREWGTVYEGEAVDLWLDATVVGLELETGGERVVRARARTRSGRAIAVGARVFVLAAGGIENARLLLCSLDPSGRALGNQHDQVGRYLMNHPKNYHGIIELARPVQDLPYYLGCLHRGYAGYAGLRIDPKLQRQRELLNSYVRLEPLFPWSDDAGVEALVLLVKQSKGFLRRWKKRGESEVVALRDYSETGDDSDRQNARRTAASSLGLALTVLAHLPRVVHYLFFRLTRAKPKIRRLRVRNFMEMEPVPENRVMLAEERDANGQAIPLVRHRASALDRRSLLALHEELGAELEKQGLGRLETTLARADPWPIDQDASHHMGTTRMGTNARTSVVNTDCRLHDVDNVYLAGASVFPTSGCANPTFTIVALAIRLARHLERAAGARAK